MQFQDYYHFVYSESIIYLKYHCHPNDQVEIFRLQVEKQILLHLNSEDPWCNKTLLCTVYSINVNSQIKKGTVEKEYW